MKARNPVVRREQERAALDDARQRFVQWRADWHDGGAAADDKALAALRKAARAFHKAIEPLLGDPADGTRARLLVRMQQARLHQDLQDTHYRQLAEAMVTAMLIDDALAPDVRRGRKDDTLAHVWVRFAADAWESAGGKATAAGRFADALTAYRHRQVPIVGGRDQIAAALQRRRAARQ